MKTSKPGMELSLQDYRRFALMSLWTGLIATVGFVFALIPNLELVTLSAFLGGVALGASRGMMVAMLGEAIFSALNPVGSGLGFPILYLFQIVSVGLSGLLGGWLRYPLQKLKNHLVLAVSFGVIGFVLTLVFDSLTALSFPLSAGLTEGTLWATLTTGLVFFVMHMSSNTILFALFGTGLFRLVQRQIQMHNLVRV